MTDDTQPPALHAAAGSPTQAPETSREDSLRSVHTSNLPDLLSRIAASLVVSTYQAGRVVLVRRDGLSCNTHFRSFKKPMGIAVDQHGMAIGSANSVWYLRNMPALAVKLEPAGRHDACYVPRRIHVTGGIDVHEMSWGADRELWLVNTRFSCLCTLDLDHSFSPRWRPRFISAYAPQDRCHLNGLCLIDGKPKYVTALGETDAAAGWRENKARGGILIDVDTGEVLLRGLSMPHSPRWHNDQLWVLESGEGSLARVDPQSGTWETVARLPGFTRGLDFWGPLAFIGLSQVRETAMFSGIPLVERLEERTCGVWVVDTRTGQTVAFLRFEEAVQEIFAVQLLHGVQFPEMLELDQDEVANAFVLPDDALAEVPPRLRAKPIAPAAQPPPAQGQLPAVNLEPDSGMPERFAEVYRRGLELREQDLWPAAASCFEEAVALQPEHPDAHNELACMLERLGEAERAIRHFERAISLRPDFALAHMNLGMALMKGGDLPRGLTEYEWRWQTPKFMPLACTQPQWEGGDLDGKTLLVHTEQEAGDVFQFVRFLPQVAERAERVILVAPPPLLELLETVDGIDELRTAGSIPSSAFDLYTPLLSLPRHLGTTVDTIPARVPYIPAPKDPAFILDVPANRPLKVGLAWAGSPTHGDDRLRSIRLETLLPLLETPGVCFVRLQIGESASQIAELPESIEMVDPGDAILGWLETAAVIAQLDLVISVDTAIAHLAGAMARPVWTLLATSCDWRWLAGRSDSPWYPTMRLFRQEQANDWSAPVASMTEALRQRVG